MGSTQFKHRAGRDSRERRCAAAPVARSRCEPATRPLPAGNARSIWSPVVPRRLWRC